METVNLFLKFVQFLADHYHSPICVNTVDKMYVFNLPYFSHWIIILIYKKRDAEIRINILFTDNMGNKAGPNTSNTMIVYCIKKQFFHHF